MSDAPRNETSGGLVAIGSNGRPGQELAVVIGAGGMAMAVARRLGEHHRLLVADRDGEHLERQLIALRSEGHDAVGCVCDVADAQAVTLLASQVAADAPLRVLAHVVGLSPSMADWRTILTVNFIGPTLVDNALLPLARRGTAAIFVASLAGHTGPDWTRILPLLDDPLSPDFLESVEAALDHAMDPSLAYQLSKFALIRRCQQRAAAWGARGARIASVSPGLIATPMGALEFKAQPAKFDLLRQTPLGREGTMLEIADAVEFLASERASFISGTDLLIDGGVTAALLHHERSE